MATASPREGSHVLDDFPFGRPALRVFTDTHGLPQNSIPGMAFDAVGYLWVGTEDGAARYNGRQWRTAAMPNRTSSNEVLAVFASRNGAVFFGTRGAGLARMKDGKWTTIDTGSGLPDDIVTCIAETPAPDGGTVTWVGTPKGLARIEGARIDVIRLAEGLPHEVVRALAVTRDADGHTLWVGTQGGGVARLRRGRWSVFDTSDGLPNGTVLCFASALGDDGGDVLWAGTASGLARLARGAWEVIDDGAGLPHPRVRALCAHPGGAAPPALWIGTAGGLTRYERGALRGCDWLGDLSAQSVLSIERTPASLGGGSLWLGTDGGGLVRVGLGQWITLAPPPEMRGTQTMAFLETGAGTDRETIWMGTDAGAIRIARGEVEVDMLAGLPSRDVRSFATVRSPKSGEERAVVGTDGGLVARREPGGWVPLPQFSRDPINTMGVADDRGVEELWVGSSSGLHCVREGVHTHYDRASGLPYHVVKCLLTTHGASGERLVVAGTLGGGLAVLEGERIRTYDSTSGLPNDLVLSLHESRRRDGRRVLWVGTQSGGAAWCDLERMDGWGVLSDETTPALPNNTVYQIREDAQGRLYFFTIKGVARLTPRRPTADDPSEYSVYVFTTEDGLPSNECNAGASLVDSRGRIWVGTVGGTAVYDPAHEHADTTPKPLRISRVAVNGKAVGAGDRSLRHDENNLAFEFDLLSYFREADTRYRTQLVGFDERASDWQSEAKCSYTNLPPGRYTFKVWGRDYAGNVSGPAAVSFEVRPAPWRTWWAYLGYGAAAAGATAGAVQWRIAALRRRNELLEETVRQQTAALAEKVQQLEISEAVARDRADELARAVEQLRVLERNAQAARLEAVAAKDRAVEASQAKSAFLSSMSHELRTPLNAVLGFAQLLERDVTLTPEQREHLAAITTSGEHLLHLINDVLSLSKIEAGKLTLNVQRFDLHRLLEGVEMMMRGRSRAKGLRLRVERASSVPRFVLGDEGKLRQVLINLLGNAVKFTDEGQVTLRARWRGSIGEFEVADTGPGIAAEELPALFEPFAQTETGRKSKDGTGLGLAISRNFVQMMGGDIRVRSAPGEGAVFTFDCELPLDEAVVEDEGRRIVADLEPNQPDFRILVVDDAERNRALLVKLLSTVGFAVAEAVDGREAVAVWASWRPHAVLMDVRMPVLDGKQATREIRALEQELAAAGESPAEEAQPCRIVALTASVFENERREILACGFDDFLMKPFREEDLFDALSRHLGVRFRYLEMDKAPSSGANQPVAGERLVPDRFRELPAPLLAELGDAVLKGDVEIANRLADEVHRHDADLAATIRALIRAYRFDELQEVIDRAQA